WVPVLQMSTLAVRSSFRVLLRCTSLRGAIVTAPMGTRTTQATTVTRGRVRPTVPRARAT
ncbi:hypothetical protein, partial [Bacteroides ovatus]|uniref:hypothetical protein n=1 Tax=Bacteroides ovatus TaxID=28116 RepID=UPI001C703647